MPGLIGSAVADDAVAAAAAAAISALVICFFVFIPIRSSVYHDFLSSLTRKHLSICTVLNESISSETERAENVFRVKYERIHFCSGKGDKYKMK